MIILNGKLGVGWIILPEFISNQLSFFRVKNKKSFISSTNDQIPYFIKETLA